jgi:hypothetical protein
MPPREAGERFEEPRRPCRDGVAREQAPHVEEQLRRAAVAGIALERERALHDGREVALRVAAQRAQTTRRLLADAPETLGRAPRAQVVRRLAGQRGEEQRAERPDVAALVRALPARLLGTHRGERSEHFASAGSAQRLLVEGLLARQAEVEDVRVQRRVDEHVRGLEIAMQDAALVSVRDRFADLGERAQRGFERCTAKGDVERGAFDELGDEIGRREAIAHCHPRVQHSHDGRMREARENARFSAEAFRLPRALGVEAQELHGREAAVIAMPRSEDDAGSSRAERLQQLVAPDRARALGFGESCCVGRFSSVHRARAERGEGLVTARREQPPELDGGRICRA